MKAEQTLLEEPQWENRWARREVSAGSAIGGASKAFPSRTPMWEFCNSHNLCVVSQLPVNVCVSREGPNEELEEQIYLLSCESLHIFASANNYWDAERRFKEQVVHYFLHYTQASADDLDRDARQIQYLYQQHFQVRE